MILASDLYMSKGIGSGCLSGLTFTTVDLIMHDGSNSAPHSECPNSVISLSDLSSPRVALVRINLISSLLSIAFTRAIREDTSMPFEPVYE